MHTLTRSLLPVVVELLCIEDPQSCHYLNQSGCISDPTINDREDFEKVRFLCAMYMGMTFLIVVLCPLKAKLLSSFLPLT